jgi:hypothetical protein
LGILSALAITILCFPAEVRRFGRDLKLIFIGEPPSETKVSMVFIFLNRIPGVAASDDGCGYAWNA